MQHSPSLQAGSSSASKKFLAFYRIRRFITVSTTARHMSLFWARLIQSTHPVFLLSRLCPSTLSSSNRFFPSRFPTKQLCISRLPHTFYMQSPSRPFWFDDPDNIWWGTRFMKLLIMHFSLLSCYFLFLGLNCIPQHLVVEYTQPVFFRLCRRPSFHPWFRRCQRGAEDAARKNWFCV